MAGKPGPILNEKVQNIKVYIIHREFLMLRRKKITFTENSLTEFSVCNTCNTAASVRHHSFHNLKFTCMYQVSKHLPPLSPPLNFIVLGMRDGMLKTPEFLTP